jgi:hypothetical protein
MNNENNVPNVNFVPSESETTLTVETTAKVLKRQPGLGRLNRLIAASMDTVVSNGHANKRFKRDYKAGAATYKCPNCGATAVVSLEQARGKTTAVGDAFIMKCSVVNS